MNLKFTKQAGQDLDDIWDYIAEDNPHTADRFTDFLHEKCRQLTETPEIGRGRPEIREGIRSFPVGNYLIFYQLIRNDVIIVRVLSGYRDIPSLFEE